ncbi:3726_t:CDS:2, partial [Funneliformis geosporum]
LTKAIPEPIPEFHGISIIDHAGNILLRSPYKQTLRCIISRSFSSKCIGYEETKEGGSQGFCDIPFGADGINYP